MKNKMFSTLLVVVILAASAMAATIAGIDIPYKNVALNCEYYYNTVEPSGGYADPDNVKITDGDYTWSWGAMAGFNSSEESAEIEIDLGKKQSIVGLSVLNMLSTCSGVKLPEAMQIEVSTDGNQFTKIADLKRYPEEIKDETWQHWFSEFAAVEAQYVRVTITLVPGTWCMVPEVFVWSK